MDFPPSCVLSLLLLLRPHVEDKEIILGPLRDILNGEVFHTIAFHCQSGSVRSAVAWVENGPQ